MKSDSSVRGSTSLLVRHAVDADLHSRPASLSARRVSSVTSARRVRVGDGACGELRGLLGGRAVEQRALGVGGTARAHHGDRRVLAAEDDGHAGGRERPARLLVLVERGARAPAAAAGRRRP